MLIAVAVQRVRKTCKNGSFCGCFTSKNQFLGLLFHLLLKLLRYC